MIEAERVGASSFQTVPSGDPIVEFAYFQTASGPGTVQGTAVGVPVPVTPAPYPQLQQQCASVVQPTSASPLAGALTDLHTYTQWSWPLDGATAAYYGYDVNVEFVESYVNMLYAAFSRKIPELSLHFRCVDRNNNHVLLSPKAIHVPSIPQQSALVAAPITLPLPSYIPQTPVSLRPWLIGSRQQALLAKRAAQPVRPNVFMEFVPAFTQSSLPALIREANLSGRNSALAIQQISPGLAGTILHEIEEYNAGQQDEQLWFRPFMPSTRYTLDVVAGPLNTNRDLSSVAPGVPGANLLGAVLEATDAIGLLTALQNYFAYEDSLTTLERVQFTTSRYANFTAHLANIAGQLAGAAGATPIRNYVAAEDPLTWLAGETPALTAWVTAGVKYLGDRQNLASLVASFDPMADDLWSGSAPAITNGPSALVNQRQAVAADWAAFSQAANALFNGIIAAIGQPQIAANNAPIAVPDTEISFFTDSSGRWIEAILIQSPEPLPWQRIWRWIRLSGSGTAFITLLPLWSDDGTAGLLVPVETGRGIFSLSVTFQGNLGAEAPCITQDVDIVLEPVPVGSIRMGPPIRRIPREKQIEELQRPVLSLASRIQEVLHK